MDLIERYIYAVVRGLPSKRRTEVEQDLRHTIGEKLQQRSGEQPAQPADIEAVLLELGDPRRLADEYRGSARHLIGPDFFETYWLVLRIVLLAVGGGILIATALRLAMNPPPTIWWALGEIWSSLYNALMGAFGMVTLIFALNEYLNDPVSLKKKAGRSQWNLSQLPFRPASGLAIKRADPIVALIFLGIFLIILNASLDMVGLYIHQDGSFRVVPLLSETFDRFIPWINLTAGLAIVLEGIKLIKSRWTVSLVVFFLIQKTLSLVVGLRIFADPRIFSSDFFQEIETQFRPVAESWPADLTGQICRVMTIILIVGFVIDVLTTGWKAVKIANAHSN